MAELEAERQAVRRSRRAPRVMRTDFLLHLAILVLTQRSCMPGVGGAGGSRTGGGAAGRRGGAGGGASRYHANRCFPLSPVIQYRMSPSAGTGRAGGGWAGGGKTSRRGGAGARHSLRRRVSSFADAIFLIARCWRNKLKPNWKLSGRPQRRSRRAPRRLSTPKRLSCRAWRPPAARRCVSGGLLSHLELNMLHA